MSPKVVSQRQKSYHVVKNSVALSCSKNSCHVNKNHVTSWSIAKYCIKASKLLSPHQKSCPRFKNQVMPPRIQSSCQKIWNVSKTCTKSRITSPKLTHRWKSYYNFKRHITSFNVLTDGQMSYHITKSCIILQKVVSHYQKSVCSGQKSNHVTKNSVKLSRGMTCDKKSYHFTKSLDTSPKVVSQR